MRAAEFGVLALIAVAAFLLGTRFPNAPWAKQKAGHSISEKSQLLGIQRTCADQADKFYKDGSQKKQDVITGYTDHYNSKLEKCFGLFSSTDYSTPGVVVVFEQLQDVFEGTSYGIFLERNDTKQKPAPLPSVTCTLTPPIGASRSCLSKTEWDDSVGPYMKD
jgi:hypothetical protein